MQLVLYSSALHYRNSYIAVFSNMSQWHLYNIINVMLYKCMILRYLDSACHVMLCHQNKMCVNRLF